MLLDLRSLFEPRYAETVGTAEGRAIVNGALAFDVVEEGGVISRKKRKPRFFPVRVPALARVAGVAARIWLGFLDAVGVANALLRGVATTVRIKTINAYGAARTIATAALGLGKTSRVTVIAHGNVVISGVNGVATVGKVVGNGVKGPVIYTISNMNLVALMLDEAA